MEEFTLSFAAILPILAANLFADRLASTGLARRRRLSSFSGGLAAAYVFLLVLPKLADQQAVLERTTSEWPLVEYFYHHAYLMGLAGFATYYLVDVLAEDAVARVPRGLRGVVLVLGFGVYMFLIGDLVAAQASRPLPLALFSTALALHLLGLNLSLYAHLSLSWSWLRVWFSTCLLLGWLVGFAGSVPQPMHALVSAWLAGGIIVLVVLTELPATRRPGAFLAGILAFAALLKLSLYLTGAEGGV